MARGSVPAVAEKRDALRDGGVMAGGGDVVAVGCIDLEMLEALHVGEAVFVTLIHGGDHVREDLA